MLWMYCIVRPYRSESLTSSRARRDAIAICNCLAVWGSGKRRHIADQHPLMVCACVRVVKFETTLGRLSSSSMHAFGRTYTPVM